MEPAISGKLFGYGVWRAPVLLDGLPAIWAVDSFGVVRKVRKIRPGEDAEALADRLFAWLHEHHPERKLELVRQSPPSPPPPAPRKPREIDPRLLSDPRSPLAKRAYLNRLVKSAAQRSGIMRFRPYD